MKRSANAWLSYALGADRLITEEITSGDVKIESFIPASTNGKYEFTVSLRDVNIGGVDRPTSGKVFIDGKDIFSFDDDKLAILRSYMLGSWNLDIDEMRAAIQHRARELGQLDLQHLN